MGTGFTRRRFLKALAAGAAYLALATAGGGCGPLERTWRLGSLQVPRLGPLGAPKVWPLPSVKPKHPKGVWSFHSRPDLGPAAAVVTTQAHDTAQAMSSWPSRRAPGNTAR
jgi:hypothetical protein